MIKHNIGPLAVAVLGLAACGCGPSTANLPGVKTNPNEKVMPPEVPGGVNVVPQPGGGQSGKMTVTPGGESLK